HEAEVPADGQVLGGDLVTGKHDALWCAPDLRPRDLMRALQVGAEVLHRLPGLEAVVVREGVRPDLLPRRIGDAPDEGRREMTRIVALVLADLLQRRIRGEAGRGIRRAAGGQ